MVYTRDMDMDIDVDTAEGGPLEFSVSGKLWKNALLMYDRQTHSLWSHITGEAIEGPLEGKILQRLPSTHTTWGEWKEAHPSTGVLSKGGLLGSRYNSDQYQSYYTNRGWVGMMPLKHADNRVPAKDHVVGVKVGTVAMAYPFSYMEESPVVNDEIDGTELLVLFSRQTRTATVFSRRLGDRTLTFKEGPGPESGRADSLVMDNETGSLWHALTGEAVEGELKGERLKRVPNMVSFWFAWKDYFPDTVVFGSED